MELRKISIISIYLAELIQDRPTANSLKQMRFTETQQNGIFRTVTAIISDG